MRSWVRFNLVGMAGAAVQLVSLWVFVDCLRIGQLTATALAVEIAILHNFVWHLLWTFSDRTLAGCRLGPGTLAGGCGPAGAARPFLKFQFTAGAISLLGNIVTMHLAVQYAGWNYLAANGVAIVACATANYVLADRFSFRHIAAGKP